MKSSRMSESFPDYVADNQRYWNRTAGFWVPPGERSWKRTEPVWGVWQVPESDVEMLPADMNGLDTIELGCGTAYVSGWMARRGANATGIDISEEQLKTARRLAREHGVDLTLHHGNAETVPAADGSFDFAISEYGAAIWCEPETWLREAHRILCPGGRLVFLGNHPVVKMCSPLDGSDVVERLVRLYFDMRVFDWRELRTDPGGLDFCLSLSGWMALFRQIGFVVDDIREPRAAATAEGTQFSVAAEWAKRWPSELIWKVHKT